MGDSLSSLGRSVSGAGRRRRRRRKALIHCILRIRIRIRIVAVGDVAAGRFFAIGTTLGYLGWHFVDPKVL